MATYKYTSPSLGLECGAKHPLFHVHIRLLTHV
jgi:hypothetical protein